MNGYAGEGNPLACWGEAQEIALMGSSNFPAGNHVNIVAELVFHTSFGIGKCSAKSGKELLQSFAMKVPCQGRMVNTIGETFHEASYVAIVLLVNNCCTIALLEALIVAPSNCQ